MCVSVTELVVSRPDPPISAALDVLRHQHAERKVWKLLHGKRVRLVCNYSYSEFEFVIDNFVVYGMRSMAKLYAKHDCSSDRGSQP